MTHTSSIPTDVMGVLQRASTGMVSDALLMSGIKSALVGIRPVRGFEDSKIIGPAATVTFSAPRPGAPQLNNYRVIEACEAGSVLVIDGQGFDGHFTGDNQGSLARRRGLAGIVVFGGARDLAGYREMGLPLYCTGSATGDKPADWKITAFNEPVKIGDVTVRPGDIILADEDGVVSIPAEATGILMDNLRVIFEMEEKMGAAIERGASAEELTAIIAMKKPKK